ncbi:MAG: extracellular solute-binding protein [Patescibacteria group bacterium]
MNNFKSHLLLSLMAILLLSSASCSRSGSPDTGDGGTVTYPKEEITLEYYRLWDDDTALDEIIKEYTREHKNVHISVHNIAMPEGKTIYDYQRDIIKQIADGEGPDMFMIHNDWLPYQINQISPLPSSIMTLDSYKQKYPEVVVDDFVANSKIYAVPYYIDNLMLFYNTDLFSDARVPREKTPPKTWSDLVDIVPALTKYDANHNIVQSAITLGTDDQWIPRFAEILATLIMQYGGTMTTTDHTKATFDLPVNAATPYYPGENALKFYTDFANPSSPLYTYSDATDPSGKAKFPGDIQAFMEGKSAMLIGYSYQVNNIKKYSGGAVHFATAKLPQWRPEEPVVVANYWGETVSKNCKYPNVAWDFINYVSLKSNVRSYLNNTGHVPATKELTETYLNKSYLAPIASQIKFSKSWYRSNTAEVEKIFANMVNNVLHQGIPAKTAIDVAVQEINALI